MKWLMIARRSPSGRVFAGLPWNTQASWNAAPPRGTSTGTSSTSTPAGLTSLEPGEPVLRGVEASAGWTVRPPVRPAHVIDRAGIAVGVVERHPAGDHVGR